MGDSEEHAADEIKSASTPPAASSPPGTGGDEDESHRRKSSAKSDQHSVGEDQSNEHENDAEPAEQVQDATPKPQEETEHKEGKISLKNDEFEFKVTNSDNWDLDLIPQWLIDKVYAEMLLDSDGEMIETETVEEEDSGEEEEEMSSSLDVKHKFSMPNVPGAIKKTSLRYMTRRQLRALIHKTRSDICYLKVETNILKAARDKMERREREIDDYVPFEHNNEVSWVSNELNKGDVCDTTSAEDSDSEAEIKPILAKDIVHFSTDKIYQTMSDNTKVTVRRYIEGLGEIAPNNFDVMRYKHGKYTKYGKAAHKGKTPLKIVEVDEALAKNDPRVALELAINDERNADILLAEEHKIDPEADPEYPGFKPSKAKKLIIVDKLKYAVQQEEQMRKDFVDAETELMIAKYRLQVHVDMNTDSVRLLYRLLKSMDTMRKASIHPVTGKLMAEKVVGYKTYVKRALLAEETKMTLTTINLVRTMKKSRAQLKINKNLGEKVGFIDFEELRITNARMVEQCASQNQDINELKLIETGVSRIMKEAQKVLLHLTREQKRTTEEINRRNTLLISFYNDFLLYQRKLQEVIKRSSFLKRMHTTSAPDTLEYIRIKSEEYKLHDSVTNLKQKIRHINDNIVAAKNEQSKMEKKLPPAVLTDKGSESWMDEIKKEVEEKNLLQYLDDSDIKEGRAILESYKCNVGISGLPIRKGDTDESVKQGSKMAAMILKMKKNKKNKRNAVVPKYDLEENDSPLDGPFHQQGNDSPKTFNVRNM